jgi:hypothetical protein
MKKKPQVSRKQRGSPARYRFRSKLDTVTA